MNKPLNRFKGKIVSNILCYNLYGYLLKRFSATFVSFAGFTTPLFTALWGWTFLGETVTWPFYFSFTIVFAGLLLFYQEELTTELNSFSYFGKIPSLTED